MINNLDIPEEDVINEDVAEESESTEDSDSTVEEATPEDETPEEPETAEKAKKAKKSKKTKKTKKAKKAKKVEKAEEVEETKEVEKAEEPKYDQESLDAEVEDLLTEDDELASPSAEPETEEKPDSPKTKTKAKKKESDKPEGSDAKPTPKAKKKRKRQKIDLNKSPKLKRIVTEAERIDDPNELKDRRDSHNQETRELINRIKKIQTEISNVRTQALEYRDKRDLLNKGVQDIKKAKLELAEKLNSSRSQLRDAKNEARKSSDDSKKRGTGSQIRGLKRKIDALERKIETENLEINEENQIVDEIDKLERSLQELVQENRKPNMFKGEVDNIRSYREGLKKINDNLRDKAEESQNYHLLYLDVSKEIDEYRSEKRGLQRELNENRYVADVFHTRLIEISQKQNRAKRIQRKSQYQNKKKIRKEIHKITLEEAKEKLKTGTKLNLFEARALLEDKASKSE